jgi:hypothetical protein
MAGSLSILAAPWRARTCSACLVIIAAAASARALDCNGNSVEDSADIAAGSSRDCNSNRVPDECDVRGHPLAFEESSFFETSSAPRGMTAGDLDGDGREDLAFVSDDDRGSLGILERLSDGFVERKIPLGSPAISLVAADLDGDGDRDLAAAGTFTVTVARNEGALAFTLEPRTALGTSPEGIASGDLDGDGDLDLMTANSLGLARLGNSSVLRNTGAGAPWDVRNYAAQMDPGAIALMDLDDDGDLDAAVANRSSQTISFLSNDGRGGFLGESPDPAQIGFSPQSLAHADVNGDGRVDFVLKARDSGTLLVLQNMGAGQFLGSIEIDVKTPGGALVATDTDRDGDTDLVVGSSEVIHLENEGRNTFLPTRVAPVSGDAIQASTLIAIDFNYDGDTDIVLGRKDPDGVVVLGNHGAGAFDSLRYTLPQSPESLLAWDLDGDGDVDIVAADREHFDSPIPGAGESVDVLLNDGAGHLQPSSSFRLAPGPDSMVAGDLDADGDADIAVGFHGLLTPRHDAIAFLIQRRPGAFTEGTELQVGCCPSGLDLADLDADGDLDLAIGFDGSVYSYSNDGLGIFSLVGGVAMLAGGSIVAKDLNGDGRTDLMTVSSTHIEVSLNQGSPFFEIWNYFTNGRRGARDLACSDLDHDGDVDAAMGFGETVASPPSVLWNDGAGAFHEPSALDFDLEDRAWSVAAADLDGDGGDELVALSNITNRAAVYRKLGARLERTENLVLVPARETLTQGAMVLGDMDSDGDADFVLGTVDGILIVRNRFERGSSPDEDRDGIPDECIPFLRGDADSSGVVDLTDAISILGALFLGNRDHLTCERSADTDSSGDIDLTDAVFLLRHLFQGGDPPPAPYPACGLDPGPDGLSCASSQTCG